MMMRHTVSYPMKTNPTQSSIDRQSGKFQVDEQRENILKAAETLFLHNGLENTSMIDIARQAENHPGHPLSLLLQPG